MFAGGETAGLSTSNSVKQGSKRKLAEEASALPAEMGKNNSTTAINKRRLTLNETSGGANGQ